MCDEIKFDRKSNDGYWLANDWIEVCPDALNAEFVIPKKAKILWMVLHHEKPKGRDFVRITDVPTGIAVDGCVYYVLGAFYNRLLDFGFPLYIEVYYR